MAVTVRADDVSIRYITGDFKDIGLKEYVMRKLSGNYHVNEFMAVDGVSFELEEGDMLGIIGVNGAGKSTLLKAVAGIMEPTRGNIEAHGEVAALLELGSGFDGDLTVKENAYLRGAMLGYTRQFMDDTYEQIIDFAELRGFEDRPFKQLSSGMRSRLAFSIASLVKPDILILDEVLSVGDGAFQEKSAQKMREIISGGATTILVSHSLDQIRELCNKVLWLDHGKQVAFGGAEEICDRYEAFLRGEYKIEYPVTEQEEAEPEQAKEPKKVPEPGGQQRSSKWLPRAVLACFAAFILWGVCTAFIKDTSPTHALITAVQGTGNVTFRGGEVDGVWYSPGDMQASGGNWTEDPVQATYTAVDGQPLEIDVPAGEERTLTFNAGPDEGVAEVDIGGEHIEFDLKNESVVELGLPHQLPASGHKEIPVFVWLLAAAVIFLLLCLTGRASKASGGGYSRLERNKSIDGLRGILAATIALFHFGQAYGVGNLFHRGWFAVEVFFLISGFLLADKLESSGDEISLTKIVYQRMCYLYPVYFVSVIMLLMLYNAQWFSWHPFAETGYTAPLLAELLCVQVTGVSDMVFINGPVWYVSALLLATIIVTSVWLVFPRKASKYILALSAFVIYGLFFIYDPSMNSAGYFPGTRLPSPLLRGIAGMGSGCCLYWVYQRFYERAKQFSWLNIVSVEACVIMLCLMSWAESDRMVFLVIILASIVILTMFWLGERGKFPILNSRPVQYLGKISYTFFVMQSLFQNFVSGCIAPYISDHLLLNVIYITLNLLLSAALYPVLEGWAPQNLLKLSKVRKRKI